MDMESQGDGILNSVGGFTLSLDNTTFDSSKEQSLTFSITDKSGDAITKFETEQTKKMHLILERSDLSGYQHVHPTESSDGKWAIPVTFPNGGTWRVIADFIPSVDGKAGIRTVLGADIEVSGDKTEIELPEPSTTVEVDGFSVSMSGTPGIGEDKKLTFTVSKDKKAVDDLQTYLGAFGHLVALRKGDLSYTHLHPVDEASGGKGGPDIKFSASVPSSATYRLYFQFADSTGEVHTAGFTIVI